MSEFEIKIPKDDIRAIMKSMERARKELGNNLGGSVKMAGVALSRSLGTSTRISDKKRPYEIIQTRRARGARPKSSVVDIRSAKAGKFTRIIDGGKREINKSNAVKIGMRGIAKASWRWASRKAKSPARTIGKKDITHSAEKWASRYADGQSQTRGDDPFYKIESRISYINQAMDQGAANDAMRRAASGLNKWIDNELKKKFKAK